SGGVRCKAVAPRLRAHGWCRAQSNDESGEGLFRSEKRAAHVRGRVFSPARPVREMVLRNAKEPSPERRQGPPGGEVTTTWSARSVSAEVFAGQGQRRWLRYRNRS